MILQNQFFKILPIIPLTASNILVCWDLCKFEPDIRRTKGSKIF